LPERYWIFQANPERYPLREKLANLRYDYWNLGRVGYRDPNFRVQDGDRIAFWQSGADAGIEGFGVAISGPYRNRSANDPYWVVDLRYERLLTASLGKEELQASPRLQNLSILKMEHPHQTVFPVEPGEWGAIEELAKGRGSLLLGTARGADMRGRPPTIFARVGWMLDYAGPRPGDEKPLGGGAWNETHLGHEVANFLNISGRLYGYFETGGTLRLDRVGPLSGPDFVDNVTIAWFAPQNGDGDLVLVGWYKDARLYSESRPRSQQTPGVDDHSYVCETPAELGTLLKPNERVVRAETGHGGFGQRNFRYILDGESFPETRPWIRRVLDYIDSRPPRGSQRADSAGGRLSPPAGGVTDLSTDTPTISAAGSEGEDWSADEVQVVVNAYFEMLRLESRGVPYTKADFRRRVANACPGRSEGAIERKFQNTSAVLEENGLPWIDGYKPARNYQALLAEAIRSYLDMSLALYEPPSTPGN
jgi:predicted RNA-binding protein with PUA-like domain